MWGLSRSERITIGGSKVRGGMGEVQRKRIKGREGLIYDCLDRMGRRGQTGYINVAFRRTINNFMGNQRSLNYKRRKVKESWEVHDIAQISVTKSLV